MKTKIIIITLILVFTAGAVLGFTVLTMTPEEAYEAAADNNVQFEIDQLNLQLKQIAHDKNLKSASIPAYNNYYGQLTKLYNPFISETNLEVEKMRNDKAHMQLEIDVVSAAINLENAALAYDEADMKYSEAKTDYNNALKDSAVSSAEKLSLEYTMKSQAISLNQAKTNLEAAQRKLDNLVGEEGSAILLPLEYSDPYLISADLAYESALETDISIYQAMRNAEAATIKFEIADKYLNEDEETYISALIGLKSAESSYEKALVSLEINVLDDINNLKTKYDSISLALLNKKIKLDAYSAAASQYEAGIISASSLENSEASYITAVKQLDSKIHDYMLASMRFIMNYGYEF